MLNFLHFGILYINEVIKLELTWRNSEGVDLFRSVLSDFETQSAVTFSENNSL